MHYIKTITWAGKAREKRYPDRTERIRAWTANMADREIRLQVLLKEIGDHKVPLLRVQKSKDIREAVDTLIEALVTVSDIAGRDLVADPLRFDAFLPNGAIVRLTTAAEPKDKDAPRELIIRRPELHWFYDGRPVSVEELMRIKE